MLRISRLKELGFLRNVFLVMSGSGIAQVISFLAVPILGRLYTPADFGLFGCFFTVVGLVGTVVTLQYSQALMLPDKEPRAAHLFLAAVVATGLFSVASGLVALPFRDLWVRWTKAPEMSVWLWLIPVAVIISGLNQVFGGWCTRRKAFKHLSAASVVSSIAKTSSQIGLGLWVSGPAGLIVGLLFGDLLAILLLGRWIQKEDGALIRTSWNKSDVALAARDYKDYSIYGASQNLLSGFSQSTPVLLLSRFYDMSIVGLYAFAARILLVPFSLVYTSLQGVLFQKLSEARNKGEDLVALFKKSTGLLFLVVVVPGIIGAIFAPTVFRFAFGEKWLVSGEYARWLLVWMIPGLVNMPAALGLRVLEKHRALFIFEVGLLVARVSALGLGGLYSSSPVYTIASFTVAGALMETGLLCYGWRVIHQSRPAPVYCPPELAEERR